MDEKIIYIIGPNIESWEEDVQAFRDAGVEVEVLDYSNPEKNFSDDKIQRQVGSAVRKAAKDGQEVNVLVLAHGSTNDQDEHEVRLGSGKVSTAGIISSVGDNSMINGIKQSYDIILPSCQGGEVVKALPESEKQYCNLVSLSGENNNTKVKDYYAFTESLQDKDDLRIDSKYLFEEYVNGKYSTNNATQYLIQSGDLYSTEQAIIDLIKYTKTPEGETRFRSEMDGKIDEGVIDSIVSANSIYDIQARHYAEASYAAYNVLGAGQNTTIDKVAANNKLVEALTSTSLDQESRTIMVKDALEAGAEVHHVITESSPLFMLMQDNYTNIAYSAIVNTNPQILDMLTERGLDFNSVDSVISAVKSKNYENMNHILESGSIDIREHGAQILRDIINKGGEESLEEAKNFINKYGDEIKIDEEVIRTSSLMERTFMYGDNDLFEKVEKLVEGNSDLTLEDILQYQNNNHFSRFQGDSNNTQFEGKKLLKYGFSIMPAAISQKNKEAVEYLIDKGAVIEPSEGIARSASNKEFFEFILEKSGVPEDPDLRENLKYEIIYEYLGDINYLDESKRFMTEDEFVNFFEKTGIELTEEDMFDIKNFNHRSQRDNILDKDSIQGAILGLSKKDLRRGRVIDAEIDSVLQRLEVVNNKNISIKLGFDLEAIKDGDVSTLEDGENNYEELKNMINFLGENGFSPEEVKLVTEASGKLNRAEVTEVEDGENNTYNITISNMQGKRETLSFVKE